MRLDFIGGSYKNRSLGIDGQECINFYLEFYDQSVAGTNPLATRDQDAKSRKALLPTPGKVLFATSKAAGNIRGLYTTSTNRMFGVIGNQLSEFTGSGGEINRGTLATHTGLVSFADNGNGNARGQGLIIVDGQYGYMLNLSSNTFEQITDVAFPKSSFVLFINGYFVVNEQSSTKAWFSNPYSGLDWGDRLNAIPYKSSTILPIKLGVTTITTQTDLQYIQGTNIYLYNEFGWMYGPVVSYLPDTGVLTFNCKSKHGDSNEHGNWNMLFYVAGSTKYVIAEGSPDYLMALYSIHNELYMFGSQSTEVFGDTGTGLGVFERIPGAFFNNGTIASRSIAGNGSNVFWLGSAETGHGQVWQTNSWQPFKISTSTIDHMIESLPRIDDAIAYCYTQEGHEFYVLSFPSGNKTFVYDISTSEWHERAYWNIAKGKFDRDRGQVTCFFNGHNYVGDHENRNIYKLSLDTFTDNGEIVRRVRTGPHTHQERKRLAYREFEVDIERGVGLDGVGQGTEPMAFLQWSDDGGRTWSNEYWGKLGDIGEYHTRLHWHRLGLSRDRVFRLTTSDPCKVVLIDARADIQVKERG